MHEKRPSQVLPRDPKSVQQSVVRNLPNSLPGKSAGLYRRSYQEECQILAGSENLYSLKNVARQERTNPPDPAIRNLHRRKIQYRRHIWVQLVEGVLLPPAKQPLRMHHHLRPRSVYLCPLNSDLGRPRVGCPSGHKVRCARFFAHQN